MATILMFVIFCGFVGLGIPDSMFGASWPAIYADFQIPFSYANFITLILSFGTILSSMTSGRINARFSTVTIAITSTLLTAIGLVGFSVSQNLLFLCFFAIPLGLGAGAIDSALNNYTALHYNAMVMNFLHCSYGVGVTVGPLLMSFALSGGGIWRSGYTTAFVIQLCITAILVLSIPLWSKVARNDGLEQTEDPPLMKLSETLKLPGLWLALLIFFTSCGIEFTCGNWGSTFLVEAKGLPVEFAARMVTLYYIGITLGRFLSGVLAARLSCWRIIGIGLCCISLAVVLLLIPASPYLAGFGLFLVGLGNGPIFPNLVHLTPQNFGANASASVMGLQLALANTGILLVPMLFGFLAGKLGLSLLPYYLMILLVPMLIVTRLAYKKFKRG